MSRPAIRVVRDRDGVSAQDFPKSGSRLPARRLIQQATPAHAGVGRLLQLAGVAMNGSRTGLTWMQSAVREEAAAEGAQQQCL